MPQEFDPKYRRLGLIGTATAAGASILLAACSSGEGEETIVKSSTPTIGPTPEATRPPTIEPTTKPTEVVTEIPKIEGRVLGQEQLKAGITEVYTPDLEALLPPQACRKDTINAVIDSVFTDAAIQPDRFNNGLIANGLAPIAGEVDGVIETIGSPNGPQLAADIEATSRFYIQEEAKTFGADESAVEEAMEGWKINAKNLSSFGNADNCMITVAAPKLS